MILLEYKMAELILLIKFGKISFLDSSLQKLPVSVNF